MATTCCALSFRLSEQGRKQKEADRRDKYRQVQAYVTKDDGRVQAYGWSVPTQAADKGSLMSVPVPVYCRPLISADDEQTAVSWLLTPHCFILLEFVYICWTAYRSL